MPVLTAIRVLDFGQGVAGPYCGQFLADHGADVIKIEPPRGDWSRTMGTGAGVFLSVNRNKRGVCLDLRDDEIQGLVRAAALKADVIVESFRPGVMRKFGLDYATLRKHNPKLVYCSVTGFGASGPNAHLPAGDSIMQAYAGLMSINGERGGVPLRLGNVISDMLAGMNAFSGVLLALMARASSGAGQHVQTSLLDSLVAFQAPPLMEFLKTGVAPERMGNDHPLIAPSGAIATQDGSITFTVFDHQWQTFCDGLGLPELKHDPDYVSSQARQKHRDALNAILAPVFKAKTSAQWIERLRAMDILCAPVNSYPDLINDPQVVHNKLIHTLPAASGDGMPNIANPLKTADPLHEPHAAPQLGEHTEQVLCTGWGVSQQTMQRLHDKGVITCAGA
ncbi:CaiB/BaiF CoA-transferase family protein [Bordetella sp. BOR01]|uniref:CaiB/BaiF CoA transferase family protein n=1 Tax=Bordetella sp. BOR01 TaxID=2854779 RepID=UPI001C474B58|nr:CoA transferase [Bordetella sp. BOR01]MBV7485332.1 CoA transferase [Bordetella sp. BOR01]